MTTVQIDLPDELASAAKAEGLLTSEALAEMIETALKIKTESLTADEFGHEVELLRLVSKLPHEVEQKGSVTNKQHRNELEIPSTAKKCDHAIEIARIWVVENSQQSTLRSGIFKSPDAWGFTLADFAISIVDAYKTKKERRENALKSVKDGFDIAWNYYVTNKPKDE